MDVRHLVLDYVLQLALIHVKITVTTLVMMDAKLEHKEAEVHQIAKVILVQVLGKMVIILVDAEEDVLQCVHLALEIVTVLALEGAEVKQAIQIIPTQAIAMQTVLDGVQVVV